MTDALVEELVALLRLSEIGGRARTALSVAVEGRIDGILEALRDADDELATALTSALARMRRDAATQALLEALKMSNWVQKDAAELLSISPRVMNYKIKTLNIDLPRRRPVAGI